MLLSKTIILNLFISLSLATPIAKQILGRRFIDEDHNGIPDLCGSDHDGTYTCLEGGKWVNVVSSSSGTTTTTTTSAGPTSTAANGPASETSASTTTTTTIAHQTATAAGSLPTGTLIPAADWKAQNGTAWSITYEGNIGYTDTMQKDKLGGDKCRTSQLGDKVIWNCGDMECGGDWTVCGFSMGPAMYGTDSVMTINTDGITNIFGNTFLEPWSGDPAPEAPNSLWGMDTSNVAMINDTHGVAYAWEIWRGGPTISNRGNAVASITLGDTMPKADRVGPLLTGPDAIQLGLIAIMRHDDYVYHYSAGGPSNVLVTRVAATDDVFDATKYETLDYKSTTWTPGIPTHAMASSNQYGMETANANGQFGCAVYGSAFWNNYLQKFTIICNIDMLFTNMYVADTPYGPWSAEYSLMDGGWVGYGSMAHPEYSPGGSHKEIYFSQGPNGPFNVFKLTFK